MAKRKKKPPTTPAPWFRESVARQRELEAKAFAAKSDEATALALMRREVV